MIPSGHSSNDQNIDNRKAAFISMFDEDEAFQQMERENVNPETERLAQVPG